MDNLISNKARKLRRPLFWRRAGLAALRFGLYAVALLLAVAFLNKVWHPIGLNRKLQSDLSDTRTQLDAVKADNARQERRVHYLQTPQGAASEARKLGYHFHGETPLRLQEPPAPNAAPASPR